jgi:hypothetical protein
MALAVAEMPATGTYDFGWVVEHVRNSKEQAGSGGDKRLILVDVGGGQEHSRAEPRNPTESLCAGRPVQRGCARKCRWRHELGRKAGDEFLPRATNQRYVL